MLAGQRLFLLCCHHWWYHQHVRWSPKQPAWLPSAGDAATMPLDNSSESQRDLSAVVGLFCMQMCFWFSMSYETTFLLQSLFPVVVASARKYRSYLSSRWPWNSATGNAKKSTKKAKCGLFLQTVLQPSKPRVPTQNCDMVFRLQSSSLFRV